VSALAGKVNKLVERDLERNKERYAAATW